MKKVETPLGMNSFFQDGEEEHSKKYLKKRNLHISEVIILFSGDSGDGIQLLGNRFSFDTALRGK